MPSENELIQQLAAAQRAALSNVDAVPYAAIDRAAAYRIQAGVRSAIGATTGMLKTAIQDGTGVAAPIYAANIGNSGELRLSSATVTGLEVEIGLVLSSDLSAETAINDEAAIVEAIDHYFVGVEVCGTRFADRGLSGVQGGLADNMSSYGYAIDPVPRDPGADIDGFDIELTFNGNRIYMAPAKHGFGGVLNSFVAYARSQVPDMLLKAGTVVTTGSMCGLVPVTGPGHVVAVLGNHKVEFDLV